MEKVTEKLHKPRKGALDSKGNNLIELLRALEVTVNDKGYSSTKAIDEINLPLSRKEMEKDLNKFILNNEELINFIFSIDLNEIKDLDIKEFENTIIPLMCSVLSLVCYYAYFSLEENKNEFPIPHPFEHDIYTKLNQFVGYWAAKTESKKQKVNSGTGQKKAQQQRIEGLTKALQAFLSIGYNVRIDKGLFRKLLRDQFPGAELTALDPKTLKSYKEAIEEKAGIKIVWEKGAVIPE